MVCSSVSERIIEVAIAAKDRYAAPHQTFVTIPNASHATIEQSPDQDPGKSHCGMQAMVSFLNAPIAPPDTSCLGTLLPLSFASYPETNQTVWATPDTWDNVPGPIASSPHAARAIRSLERPRRRTWLGR